MRYAVGAALGALAFGALGVVRAKAPASRTTVATPGVVVADLPLAQETRVTSYDDRVQLGVAEQNPIDLDPPSAPRPGLPVTLVLHGREMDPSDMCDRFRSEGRAGAWLACPAGNAEGADAFDWGGSAEDRLDALDAQLRAIDRLAGSPRSERADIVVGFSRGAFLARDYVEHRPGRFHAMILLGAAVTLSPAKLRDAGVRRVLFACGDKDEARPSMVRSAAKLAANGVATRFMSLGPRYHELPHDLGPVMAEALAWARASSN